MNKSALNIGAFTANDSGFTGKLDTLGVKANLTLERQTDKAKDSHPVYVVLSGGREIGAAWDRSSDLGAYVSVAFEDGRVENEVVQRDVSSQETWPVLELDPFVERLASGRGAVAAKIFAVWFIACVLTCYGTGR